MRREEDWRRQMTRGGAAKEGWRMSWMMEVEDI